MIEKIKPCITFTFDPKNEIRNSWDGGMNKPRLDRTIAANPIRNIGVVWLWFDDGTINKSNLFLAFTSMVIARLHVE